MIKKTAISREEISDVFSSRLKQAINAQGTALRVVAHDTGISRSTMEGYVYGYTLPNTLLLVTLAEYLHVSIDWLLGRKGGVMF